MCNDVKHDAASVEFDRARETPRRQTAVEAMLAMGFVWGDGAWRAQSGGDMQDERNRWFIRAGEYLKRAQAAEAKLTSSPAAPGTDLEQFRDCVTTTRAIALQTMSNALNHCAESAALDAMLDRTKAQVAECDRLLALIDASPKGGSSVRAQFEAWLPPSWSQEGDTDEDGDFVYREDWVQGAWIGYQAAMQATSAEVVA